jgi:hypothetical protein
VCVSAIAINSSATYLPTSLPIFYRHSSVPLLALLPAHLPLKGHVTHATATKFQTTRTLQTPKICHRIHKNPRLHSYHESDESILTAYFHMILFNIILPTTSRSSGLPRPFRLPNQNCIRISYLRVSINDGNNVEMRILKRSPLLGWVAVAEHFSPSLGTLLPRGDSLGTAAVD